MTGGPTPLPVSTEASKSQTPAVQSIADSSNVFATSSPVQPKSHPFLRKFSSYGLTGTPVQGAAASGSSAFSTSASSGSGRDSSDNGDSNRRKSVDEAIAAAASGNAGNKSPTLAAADATDAIINNRIGHFQAHQEEGCCHTGDDAYLDSSNLPPISTEARRFTDQLLGQNKAWAIKTEEERPGFFAKLEKQQKPQVLWIGCSDSRVPANQIVNLDPGEIFVHRNIANVVTHTDMNLLSVLEYAVDVLKVRHIIICGHYGCGGVAASLTQKQFGIIDNWLRNIKDLYTIHRSKFEALPQGSKEQQDLLTELNVIQSALNVSHTSILQRAWSRGEELSIHGWCYRLSDGMIRNLGLCIEGPGNVEDVYCVAEPPK